MFVSFSGHDPHDVPGTSSGGETIQGKEAIGSAQRLDSETMNAARVSSSASEESDNSNSSISTLLENRRKRLTQATQEEIEEENPQSDQEEILEPQAKFPRLVWPAMPEQVFANREECQAFIDGILHMKNSCQKSYYTITKSSHQVKTFELRFIS